VLVRRVGSEPPGIGAIKGDLSNRDALARVVEKLRPDCVLHLAAEIATQRYADKVDEVNVQGTRRLLDACPAAGGGKLVRLQRVGRGARRRRRDRLCRRGRARSAGALYHVVDDEPIRYHEFVALTARALGVGGPGGSRRGSPGGLRVPIPSRRSCAWRAARIS